MHFCCLQFVFFHIFFSKILSGLPSECQTVGSRSGQIFKGQPYELVISIQYSSAILLTFHCLDEKLWNLIFWLHQNLADQDPQGL